MPGDHCDLWFEDAWWDTEVVSCSSNEEGKRVFRVRSLQYDVYHEVEATRLRPTWTFDEQSSKMKCRFGGRAYAEPVHAASASSMQTE